MSNFWNVVGALLLGWAAYDVYAGYTLLHTVIYRDQDPTLYWVTVSIWAIMGISCFFSWGEES